MKNRIIHFTIFLIFSISVLAQNDTTFWDTGRIKAITQYKDGLEHGLFISWYESGVKETEGYHYNGMKIGEWFNYYPNNELRSVYSYSVLPIFNPRLLKDNDGPPDSIATATSEFREKVIVEKKNEDVEFDEGFKSDSAEMDIDSWILKAQHNNEPAGINVGASCVFDSVGNLEYISIWKRGFVLKDVSIPSQK